VKRVFSRNADFQVLAALRENRTRRLREGVIWVEGVRNLNSAVARGWAVRALLYAPDRALSDWAQERLQSTPALVHYQLSELLHAELSGREEGSELLALVEMRDFTSALLPEKPTPLLALVDRPANRGNLGTIIRSCDALGVDALVVTGHSVDLYDPETVVATMGSFFALPIVRMESAAALDDWIATLRGRYCDFQVIGTSAHGDAALDAVDLTLPTLLLIGNETNGLSHRLTQLCDRMAIIPMTEQSEASSLNVACAATVLFYEAQRQRRDVRGG
jgi:TrmH family RNA methyltransferase